MEKGKTKNQEVLVPKCDVVELSQKDMESATGGGSAFSDVPRVKNHDYDDEVRKKI